MQLNSIDELDVITKRSNFSVFELPEDTDFSAILKNSIHIKPDEDKKTINIEKIRSLSEILAGKNSQDLFVVVENAETMLPNAANAILKALEEPKNHIHFVFLANKISTILPTILSRAQCYYMPNNHRTLDPPEYDEKTITLAKQYLSATPNSLPEIVDKIVKFNKDSNRAGVKKILDCAITLSYKSYYITGKNAYLQKLEKLLKITDKINANGHLKLQLIAGML